MAEPRCDATDLPVDMCGCKDHRPDLNVPQDQSGGDVRAVSALYSGRCRSCHTWYEVGSYIVNRDGYGWVHLECAI